MRRSRYTFKAHLLGAIIAVLFGCAHAPEPNPPAVFVPSISALQPEEYAAEIEKYQKLIASDLHLDNQQRAHLYLASLHFSPLNPNRDAKLALKHLETYALYDPDFVNGVDPRLLLAALIEIESYAAIAEAQSQEIRALSQEVELLEKQVMVSRDGRQSIQKANNQLKKRIGKLQRKIRRLETANAQLNKTIEMLSNLDSRLEEKRSNFIKTDAVEEQ